MGVYWMLILTTPNILGEKVREHKGLVTGDSLLGANLYKDTLSGVKDVVKKKEANYETMLADARKLAIANMEKQADKKGANAIIGTRVVYNNLGGQMGNTIMVTVSGTAVVIGEKATDKETELTSKEVGNIGETKNTDVIEKDQEPSSTISYSELQIEVNEMNRETSEDQIKLDYYDYDINERLEHLDTSEKEDMKLKKVIENMDKKNRKIEEKINQKR